MARRRKQPVLAPNPFYSEAVERRGRQLEAVYGFRMSPAPQFIWVSEEETSTRLLSEEQIAAGRAYYERLLDQDPKRWRPQATAAKHITVTFYKKHEGSFQTIEDQVVIPVLERRGLRKIRKRKKK